MGAPQPPAVLAAAASRLEAEHLQKSYGPRMVVKDVLALSPGSVIELDRAAGSPVDVLVNGTLIARGEVVAAPHEFAPVPNPVATSGPTGLEVLHDVALGVTAELGRAKMLVKDVLALSPGSVIELDRAAGGPVDVLVNGTLIARGEVVVIDEEFGIRITEVMGYADGQQR